MDKESDANRIKELTGAAQVLANGGTALLIYPYAPYAYKEGIIPLDSYYVACNAAYKSVKQSGLITAEGDMFALMAACGLRRGKSGLMQHPQYGPYFLVMAVKWQGNDITICPAAPCGSCKQCVNACPTGALNEGFTRALCRRDFMDKELTKQTLPYLGECLLGCEQCRRACPRRPAAVAMPPQLAALLTPESILQGQSRQELAAFIGSNMARPAVLLPQAMAYAVRNARQDLLPLIMQHTGSVSQRVRASALLAVQALSAKQ